MVYFAAYKLCDPCLSASEARFLQWGAIQIQLPLPFYIYMASCVVVLEPQQSMAHMTGTTRSIYAPSFDYDEIMPDADVPRLSHPGKDRPRLRKTHYVKRPVIVCESLLTDEAADDDAGVNQLPMPTADKMPPYVFVLFVFLFFSTAEAYHFDLI